MRNRFGDDLPQQFDSVRVVLWALLAAAAVLVVVLIVLAVRPAQAAVPSLQPSVEEMIAETCATGCVVMSRADFELLQAQARLPCARM